MSHYAELHESLAEEINISLKHNLEFKLILQDKIGIEDEEAILAPSSHIEEVGVCQLEAGDTVEGVFDAEQFKNVSTEDTYLYFRLTSKPILLLSGLVDVQTPVEVDENDPDKTIRFQIYSCEKLYYLVEEPEN